MTIKKKTLRLTLLFLILFSMFIPMVAFASGDGVTRIHDEVGLLTSSEVAALDAKLGSISTSHDFDVAVVIVDELYWSTAHQHAAEVLEYYDYGRGDDPGAIVLLIAMEDRKVGFAVTDGHGEYVFTPKGQAYLEKLYLDDIRNEQYFKGINAFADATDDFLTKAEVGNPYDRGNIPVSSKEKGQTYLICIVVGFIVGLIVALILKAQLKSVRKDAFARAYIREGSMSIRRQHDNFLYNTVSKTARSDNNSGSSGGSFSSSSGRGYSGRSSSF